MSTAAPDAPASTLIDLAGLPEPVVQSIKQLVASIRGTATVTTEHPPLTGRLARPAPEYTPEMFKRDRREAWANFPRDFTRDEGP